MTNTLLLFSGLFLLSIGVVMVYSTSSIIALKLYSDEYYFLKKELLFAALGVLLLIAMARFPYQYLSKLAYPILALSVSGLAILFIPEIGVSVGGATRWIRLGSLSIQPSECAKLGLIIYLSYFLSKKKEGIKNFSTGFLPPLIITGLMSLLVLCQPDFGTAFLFMLFFFILMFVGGARLFHLILSLILLVPAGCVLILNSPYRLKRLTAFIDPWSDPANSGFHIIQSYLAFGSGGPFGQGLGNGRQKLFYLPEAHTDFIFSVVGEELGLLGVMTVIILFFIIIYCGIKISFRARDLLGTFMALGMVSFIGMQALLNMGVVMGLLPTKGSTLPFISYGGTSLIMNLVAVGILLNISSQSRRDER
ncbi:MAG: putative lipid II flippase FtsW [Proteobacteria bacterium]|nr:putative lipid II flippase FtsW [Pseudomonadota bacterium]